MEMEQKRILWIAAAVGIFLLVVIGAALILYSPAETAETVSSSLQDTTWMNVPETLPVQAVNNPPLQADTPAPVQPVAPQTPVAESSVVPADRTGNVTVITDNTKVYSTGVTTIDVNSLKAGQENIASNAPVVSPVEAISKPAAQVSAPASNPGAAVAAKPAPAAVPAAVAVKPAPAVPATVVSAKKPLPDQFWVQAASYESKKNADNAREALMTNKIPCEVFTYTDSKAKVFYRVRVGPYATKSEAEYWQNRIALIDEFSGTQSYVTNAAAKAN